MSSQLPIHIQPLLQEGHNFYVHTFDQSGRPAYVPVQKDMIACYPDGSFRQVTGLIAANGTPETVPFYPAPLLPDGRGGLMRFTGFTVDGYLEYVPLTGERLTVQSSVQPVVTRLSWRKGFAAMLKDQKMSIASRAFQLVKAGGFTVGGTVNTYLAANDLTVVGMADNGLIVPITTALVLTMWSINRKVEQYRTVVQ